MVASFQWLKVWGFRRLQWEQELAVGCAMVSWPSYLGHGFYTVDRDYKEIWFY